VLQGTAVGYSLIQTTSTAGRFLRGGAICYFMT